MIAVKEINGAVISGVDETLDVVLTVPQVQVSDGQVYISFSVAAKGTRQLGLGASTLVFPLPDTLRETLELLVDMKTTDMLELI